VPSLSLGAKPARCSDHSGAGTAECTNHYYTLLMLRTKHKISDVSCVVDGEGIMQSHTGITAKLWAIGWRLGPPLCGNLGALSLKVFLNMTPKTVDFRVF